MDPQLVGDWILQDKVFGEDPAHGIRITLINRDTYRVEPLDAKPDNAYEAKLIEIGGKTYLEILAKKPAGEVDNENPLRPGFMQFERKGNWIALRRPNYDAFRQSILSGSEIDGRIEDWAITITSDANKLAKFLSNNGENVLDQRQVFRGIVRP